MKIKPKYVLSFFLGHIRKAKLQRRGLVLSTALRLLRLSLCLQYRAETLCALLERRGGLFPRKGLKEGEEEDGSSFHEYRCTQGCRLRDIAHLHVNPANEASVYLSHRGVRTCSLHVAEVKSELGSDFKYRAFCLGPVLQMKWTQRESGALVTEPALRLGCLTHRPRGLRGIMGQGSYPHSVKPMCTEPQHSQVPSHLVLRTGGNRGREPA